VTSDPIGNGAGQQRPIAVAPVLRDRNTDETIRRVADQLEEEIVLGLLHPRERLV